MGFVIKIIVEKVIKYVLSDSNIHMFGGLIDDYVDALQKENKEPGKLIRRRLIFTFEGVVEALKKADGIN